MNPSLSINRHSPPRTRRNAWLAGVAFFLAAAFVPAAQSQTLKMQFNFEDTGTTTTDTVSGVVLMLVDSTGTTAADFHGVPGSGVGGSGKALDFSGGAQGGAGPLAFTTNNTTITFGTISNFTIAMWIEPTATLLGGVFPRFFSLGTNGDVDRGTANTIQLLSNGNQISGGGVTSVEGFVNATTTSTTAFGAFNMPVNTWSFIALTYDGTNLSFYGGSTTASVTLQSRTNFAAGVVNLPGAFSVMVGDRISPQTRSFQGLMDNVRFYTGAANTNFLEAVRLADSPPFPPTGVVALGCNNQASLSWSNSVGATGYIVKRGLSSGLETNYALTNGLTFTDTAVSSGNTYYYEIAATNTVGPATSGEVAVTISGSGSLNVISGPTNTSTCDGSTASFTARASGPSINYDWQFSQDQGVTWIDVGASGPTFSNYTTFALSAASDNGDQFRVVISNPCGAIIPPVATVTVNSGITINTPPADQVTGTNWPATFTVGVAGSSVTYQWQKNGINLTNGANVSGATSATLVLSNLTTNDSGAGITCLVGNPCSAPIATSPPAMLTVLKNPLQLEFGFEDTTNTTSTVDSVAGVSLACLDINGAPIDLHGSNGSGVLGKGHALDFSSGNEGSTGPVALVVNATTVNFGTLSAFTVTLWVKPTTNMSVFQFPRFFTLGTAGVADRGVANSIGFLGNGNQAGVNTTGFESWVNTMQPSVTGFGVYNMPSNTWQFLAMTYDGATLDGYAGSETNAVTLISSVPFAAGTVSLGNSWNLILGNTIAGATVGSQARSLQGLLDDVRFYEGAAPSNVVEGIREQLAPPSVSPSKISATVNGTNLVLTYSTAGGGPSYILQSATNLTAPVTWTPIITNPGTGGTITNVVPISPGKPKQFLRYQAQ